MKDLYEAEALRRSVLLGRQTYLNKTYINIMIERREEHLLGLVGGMIGFLAHYSRFPNKIISSYSRWVVCADLVVSRGGVVHRVPFCLIVVHGDPPGLCTLGLFHFGCVHIRGCDPPMLCTSVTPRVVSHRGVVHIVGCYPSWLCAHWWVVNL